MTIYFCSDDPEILEWARTSGLEADHWLTTIDPALIAKGDRVMGALPIEIAAAVCSRDGQYWHLSPDVPIDPECVRVPVLRQSRMRFKVYSIVKTGTYWPDTGKTENIGHNSSKMESNGYAEIESAQTESDKMVDKSVFLAMRIEDAGFTIRTTQRAEAAGLILVREFLQFTEDQLRQKNIGRKSINEIKDVLAAYGLSIAER